MSTATYQATYSRGGQSEAVTFSNDGERLTVTVGGVTFSGSDYEDLVPDSPQSAELAGLPVDETGALMAGRFVFDVPLPLQRGEEVLKGVLRVDLELDQNRRDKAGGLHLTLTWPGNAPVSTGPHGWFEDGMAGLRAQLPAGIRPRSCFFCAYADYHPAGHGFFGGMLCFRNLKAEYRAVRGKQDLLALCGAHERFVQETFLCDEFEARLEGAGYRG